MSISIARSIEHPELKTKKTKKWITNPYLRQCPGMGESFSSPCAESQHTNKHNIPTTLVTPLFAHQVVRNGVIPLHGEGEGSARVARAIARGLERRVDHLHALLRIRSSQEQQQRRHTAAGETSEATGMSHNCCAEAEAVPEEGEVRRQAAKERRWSVEI